MSAPIISSYCAASVLWSRLFLKEKLSWKHYLMIGLVVIGIVVLGVYEALVIALILDSFPAIMLGSLLGRLASMLAQIYFLPYYTLSECGFYLRATAPEEPPRQDRSSYTPEF